MPASGGGRVVPLSPARRLVADLLRVCRDVPTVAVDRPADLSALVAARARTADRPPWPVLFAKAFALAAMQDPNLRRSYIRFPWAHLYEHAEPIAMVTVERECAGEPVVFSTRLSSAHARPLAELSAVIRHAKDAPEAEVAGLRRARRLARLPRPLRRFALWAGLHASGRLRERHSGTFAVTSVGSAGAGVARAVAPLTSTFHYGLFDAAGRIELRLTFDHRVYDGAVAARALVATERALLGPILDEVRAGAGADG
jgi:pyruvate/2-oxoglutarate dehydrogenase complex dihydrolipoamide acyltransferase (E2) component